MSSETLLAIMGYLHPPWHADAACKEAPPNVTWFPERGQPVEPARRICSGCLVRAECEQHAADNAESYGIWGGKTGKQRRSERAA